MELLDKKTIQTKVVQYIEFYKCSPADFKIDVEPDFDEDDREIVIIRFKIRNPKNHDDFYIITEYIQPPAVMNVIQEIMDDLAKAQPRHKKIVQICASNQ